MLSQEVALALIWTLKEQSDLRTPEHKLCFSVIRHAIQTLVPKKLPAGKSYHEEYKFLLQDAADFLTNENRVGGYAGAIDLESEWVISAVKQAIEGGMKRCRQTKKAPSRKDGSKDRKRDSGPRQLSP